MLEFFASSNLNGLMAALLALARVSCHSVLSRPFYTLTLLVFAGAILISPTLTLFAFAQEAQMVREMGFATMTLWGLVVAAIMSGPLVRDELEDRTALLLFSKPLGRPHFLLAKLLGLLWAQALGVLFLALAYFLALWLMKGDEILDKYSLAQGPSVWPYIWKSFIANNLLFSCQAWVLGILQLAIVSALAVSFAAFWPATVTVSTVAFLFILGNVWGHFTVSLEGAAGAGARALGYLLPNFRNFVLEASLGEGRLVSANYLLWVAAYTIIYSSLVLMFASMLFQSREIR